MPSKETSSVVLIMDEDLNGETITQYLKDAQVETIVAHTLEEGLAYAADLRPQVIVLDQGLDGSDGKLVTSHLASSGGRTKVVLTSPDRSFEAAERAVETRAFDWLPKPIDLARLGTTLTAAIHLAVAEGKLPVEQALEQGEAGQFVESYSSDVFGNAAQDIALASLIDAPVLLTGETGTGKGFAARAIHARGKRDAPFISVNCAALPDQMIEAELFGHEVGAFTGAHRVRRGVFELAKDGTLYLDEIGDMPLHLQVKLLGVLEDGEIRRIGGESVVPLSARVIAAIGTDPAAAVKQGRLRPDLFYRLSVIQIRVPPLRERRQVIPSLCAHLLARIGGKRRRELSEEELIALVAYDWPGNVRELRNVLERAAILQQETQLRPSELLNGAAFSSAPPPMALSSPDVSLTLQEVERRHLELVLAAHGRNYTQAAKSLGIALSTLKRKVKLYGL